MANEFGLGIVIERLFLKDLPTAGIEDAQKSHREDGHSFFLLESGKVSIEIDFKRYEVKPSSIIYMHPDQVHRIISFENVTVCSWSISDENLHPEYLKLLKSITPAVPLLLNKETFSLISEAVSLSLKFFKRKNDKLYHPFLKDSCNALVALVTSQYLEQSNPADKLSRFEVVTKTFRELLDRNYTTAKRPVEYANQLNISAHYLNECVKDTTGHPVSYHIQQRIILEAKRLLHYSDKSVKEIAAELGYDDYPYFSRLFTKATGMTALTFRSKNPG